MAESELASLFPEAGSLCSAVKQLLSDQKLTIPAELVHNVGWSTPREGTIKVIADLDQAGHLILALYDSVAGRISQRAKGIAEEGVNHEGTDALQVLGDRYQPLSMEAKGHRIRLTEHVLLHLGVSPGTMPWFFLCGRYDRVEIMTIEYRNRRNARWQGRTTITY